MLTTAGILFGFGLLLNHLERQTLSQVALLDEIAHLLSTDEEEPPAGEETRAPSDGPREQQ